MKGIFDRIVFGLSYIVSSGVKNFMSFLFSVTVLLERRLLMQISFIKLHETICTTLEDSISLLASHKYLQS